MRAVRQEQIANTVLIKPITRIKKNNNKSAKQRMDIHNSPIKGRERVKHASGSQSSYEPGERNGVLNQTGFYDQRWRLGQF